MLADRATQHANMGQTDYSGESACTMQGREHGRHSQKSEYDGDMGHNDMGHNDMGHDDNQNCPDMSSYIKKDSIPCWGCSLDY